jgi:hypothetical protein
VATLNLRSLYFISLDVFDVAVGKEFWLDFLTAEIPFPRGSFHLVGRFPFQIDIFLSCLSLLAGAWLHPFMKPGEMSVSILSLRIN